MRAVTLFRVSSFGFFKSHVCFFCKVLALFQGESNIKNVCFTRLQCLELKICSFSKPGIPSFLPLESGATHDPIMSIEPSRIEFQSTSIHRVWFPYLRLTMPVWNAWQSAFPWRKVYGRQVNLYICARALWHATSRASRITSVFVQIFVWILVLLHKGVNYWASV